MNQITDVLKMNRMSSAEQSFPPQLEHDYAEWSTFDCMLLDGIHHGECPANGELGKHHVINDTLGMSSCSYKICAVGDHNLNWKGSRAGAS
jgi:hypothetical protein